MSSPGDISGTGKPADLFEDLWKRLAECHQNTLQELEAKVSKLKKERCLDAQRLEVFYNRNQQLKEQNKALQDTVSLLEERLREGECDRCAILEEKLKADQDQNLDVISKLRSEINRVEDENRKLQAELQKLTSPQAEPELEEGVIPDSPVLPGSLPALNKLRKRKHGDKIKHVRYAEMPLLQRDNSLFYELIKEAGDTRNPGKTEMLVPNTCELDASQDDMNEEMEEVIAETCAFELDTHHTKMQMIPNHQTHSKTTQKHKVQLKPYSCSLSSTLIQSTDSTSERSPSILPRVKRLLEDSSVCTAKRKKEESVSHVESGIREGVDKQQEPLNQTSLTVCNQNVKTSPDNKAQSAQSETPSQKSRVSCRSPGFKKPQSKAKGRADGKKRTPPQDQNASQPESKDPDGKHSVEPAWSIDPALALSMYDEEEGEDQEAEERHSHGELADTDYTWVSHSVLQRQGEKSQDGGDTKSGLGEKANDSLDMMFDTTADGDYRSQLGQSQPCDDDDDDDEEEEEHSERNPPEDVSRERKSRQPTFKYVAVIRKKDERRKLQGTTCKECETYYAHLPEEEKQKKLSSCSRHRFLYVPPCTPENFWEVGFPSTQTCVDRGYIKEEKSPQARLRRRQPLNALFTPKKDKQQS